LNRSFNKRFSIKINRLYNKISSGVYGKSISTYGQASENITTISEGFGERVEPQISWNGTNYLAVWKDYRVTDVTAHSNGVYTVMQNAEIFAARISASGELIDKNGIKITDVSNEQKDPEVIPVADGFLAIWYDCRFGCNESENKGSIYMSKISNEGKISSFHGTALSRQGVKWYSTTACEQGGGAVVWKEEISDENDKIYVRTFNAAGVPLLDRPSLLMEKNSVNALGGLCQENRFLFAYSSAESGKNVIRTLNVSKITEKIIETSNSIAESSAPINSIELAPIGKGTILGWLEDADARGVILSKEGSRLSLLPFIINSAGEYISQFSFSGDGLSNKGTPAALKVLT